MLGVPKIVLFVKNTYIQGLISFKFKSYSFRRNVSNSGETV